MIKMRKADGKLSRSMLWNTVVMIATGVFGVAVATLPEIAAIIKPELYVLVALIVKGIDVGLRQITSEPMEKK